MLEEDKSEVQDEDYFRHIYVTSWLKWWEICFQREGQTDCGNLRRVTTSSLKQLIEVAREKCFQTEGQTDSHVRGRWDRGSRWRLLSSHLHDIFPETVDLSGKEKICFEREGQTDCGNQVWLITSTLKQLIKVTRKKFAFKEKDKLIVVTKDYS